MKHFNYFGIALMALLFFASCGNNTTREDENQNYSTTKKEDKPKKSPLQKSVEKYQQEADTNLSVLLQKFTLIEDKVEGGGWYYHKSNNKYKSHLEVPISTNGYFYLKTNYYGSDWAFHERIVVNIDDHLYYSSIVENYSDFSVSDIIGGAVVENLHLTDPEHDAYIVTLIISNSDKEITVRFEGDQTEEDITLSKTDIEVINDCFLLSQYLTVTNNKKVSKIGTDALEDGFYIIPKGNHPEASIKLKE